MRKVLLFLLLSPIILIAQEPGVAINTDGSAADAKAMLDIKSINKGILIPRMLSSERTAITPVPKGLLVFDNTTNSFWFYSGTAWEELKGGGNAGWQLLGNTGTDPATNFIGTTDNKPLHFKVSNGNAGTISVGNSILSFGRNALSSNTTGFANSAFGFEALAFNTIGNRNTGMGNWALRVNTEGTDNTALGSQVLNKNTTGGSNTGAGTGALLNNTTGYSNTQTVPLEFIH